VFTFSPKQAVSKHGFIVGNYRFQNSFDAAILVSINMSIDVYFGFATALVISPKK
jgi:hypothetical protein